MMSVSGQSLARDGSRHSPVAVRRRKRSWSATKGSLRESEYPQQSPYVSIANRQAEIMMRIASEFGFTPASRSRISTPPADEPNLFNIIERPGGEG